MRTFRLSVLLSCLLAAVSCGAKKEFLKKARPIPKNVVILPVSNQTRDLAAPVLVRYFLETQMADKGFAPGLTSREVDQLLRQMGILSGEQAATSDLQQIGQVLRVDGVVQVTLLEFRHDLLEDKTVMRAHFRLVDTETGTRFWDQEISYRTRGERKVPVKGVVNEQWTADQLRKIVKSPAGELAKDFVKKAISDLPRKAK